MGPLEWRRRSRPRKECADGGVRATQANARGPRGVRATLALRAQIPELRTGAVYLCHKRKRGGENPSDARESCQRTPQTNPDCRNESLSKAGCFRPRFSTRVEASENLLHDPGGSCSAHVHSVYRSQGEAALFLPALFRKSDSPRIRVPGDTDLD